MQSREVVGTYLVVGTGHLVSNLELAFLQLSNVQNIAIVDLNVGNFKVGLAVDGDGSSVILLTTRLGVEVGLIKQKTEWTTRFQLGRVLDKLGFLVDGLDLADGVAEHCGTILC